MDGNLPIGASTQKYRLWRLGIHLRPVKFDVMGRRLHREEPGTLTTNASTKELLNLGKQWFSCCKSQGQRHFIAMPFAEFLPWLPVERYAQLSRRCGNVSCQQPVARAAFQGPVAESIPTTLLFGIEEIAISRTRAPLSRKIGGARQSITEACTNTK